MRYACSSPQKNRKGKRKKKTCMLLAVLVERSSHSKLKTAGQCPKGLCVSFSSTHFVVHINEDLKPRSNWLKYIIKKIKTNTQLKHSKQINSINNIYLIKYLTIKSTIDLFYIYSIKFLNYYVSPNLISLIYLNLI